MQRWLVACVDGTDWFRLPMSKVYALSDGSTLRSCHFMGENWHNILIFLLLLVLI
jgi:hypothetical protein